MCLDRGATFENVGIRGFDLSGQAADHLQVGEFAGRARVAARQRAEVAEGRRA